MIISHKHRFIFVKTVKTAGTSLEIALSKFLGDEDVVTPITDDDEKLRRANNFSGPRNYRGTLRDLKIRGVYWRMRKGMKLTDILYPAKFINHSSAQYIKEQIGNALFDSYFKFTIERNSWDLVVSLYFWQKKYFWSTDAEVPTFDEYVKSGKAGRRTNFDLYSINALPSVNFILRYERLEEDLTKLSRLLQFDENIYEVMKHIKAKSGLRPDACYRDMYSEDTKKIISVQYAREIALMSYTF